ncbi:RNA-binding protein 20 [Pelodytes ibericus]
MCLQQVAPESSCPSQLSITLTLTLIDYQVLRNLGQDHPANRSSSKKIIQQEDHPDLKLMNTNLFHEPTGLRGLLFTNQCTVVNMTSQLQTSGINSGAGSIEEDGYPVKRVGTETFRKFVLLADGLFPYRAADSSILLYIAPLHISDCCGVWMEVFVSLQVVEYGWRCLSVCRLWSMDGGVCQFAGCGVWMEVFVSLQVVECGWRCLSVCRCEVWMEMFVSLQVVDGAVEGSELQPAGDLLRKLLAAMNQARDPRELEQPGGATRPALGQNASPFVDKNRFNNALSGGAANPLLPSPATLQLAQLQAQLTLQRLKLAQTAVTSNTAAATVLNQVLSKVAMSQPLFNPLRNANMMGAHGMSSLGPAMHNARFPSSGILFSAQNQAIAPKHAMNPTQNSMPSFGKGVGGNKSAAFFGGSQAFAANSEQPMYHGFTVGSKGSSGDGHYGHKLDNQPGYKKEYFDSQGQHHPMGQKGELGPVSHSNAPNSQWEPSRIWQSPNQHYEDRNELYNPEEPTPDSKFSPSNSPAFSRYNNGKITNCVTNMKNLQKHELNDFHGIPPLHLPHTCTICDKKVFNLKDWELHVKGRMHIQKVMSFSENTGIHCVPNATDGILPSSINTDFNPNSNEGFNADIDQLYIPSAPAASFLQSGLAFSGPPSGIKFAQRKSTNGRVVHICNLPEGSCNENDVVNLGLPFGKVTNYILMKSTNQAFLEMAYTEAAEAMVQYYQEKPAMINDEKLLIRMSKRYQELQLKKPGKNVDAIIYDIHSQRERDIFRDTDRFRNERTRSRSPVSRSLSPRSHTPSFTSCSSTHSPLGASRPEWGNGRDAWDQSAYGRWEDEREQSAWRDNGEDKRDRTDHWVHDRKHYSRQLEKQEMDDRIDGSRAHREKYANSHSSSRYKAREGEYYRKEAKTRCEGKLQDLHGKPKKKEDGKIRDVKGTNNEDASKKGTPQTKSNKESDSNQKDLDKSNMTNTTNDEGTKESIKESINESTREKEKQVPEPTKQVNKVEEPKLEPGRHKEEEWESESETWYPTNMEELVTVDEVGEEDLIIEPDITELEEIVSMEQKGHENCVQTCPQGIGTLDLEFRCSPSTRSGCSSPREASIAMSCTSLRDTESPASSCYETVANVPDVIMNTDQTCDGTREEKGISIPPGSPHGKVIQVESSESLNKITDLRTAEYKGGIEGGSDICVDVYKTMDLQEDSNVKLVSLHVQEEKHDKRERDLSISEEKILEVPEYESKEMNSSPSWEQDDVFTDLSIPLGVEFVVPRTGFYCKLCGLFYTSEETAKTSHCRSRVHYKNLQSYLSRLAEGSIGKSGMEDVLHQEDVGIVPQFEKNRP